MDTRFLATNGLNPEPIAGTLAASVRAMAYPAALFDDSHRLAVANPMFCSLFLDAKGAARGLTPDTPSTEVALAAPVVEQLLRESSSGPATALITANYADSREKLLATAFRLPAEVSGRAWTLVILHSAVPAVAEPGRAGELRLDPAALAGAPLHSAMHSLQRSIDIIVMLYDGLLGASPPADRHRLLPLCERALQALSHAFFELGGSFAAGSAAAEMPAELLSPAGKTDAAIPRPSETSGLPTVARRRNSPVKWNGTEEGGRGMRTAASVDGPRRLVENGPWDAVRLTPREKRIAELVIAGSTNREIAAVLGISRRTVEHHRRAAMQKSGARSVCELVRVGMGAVSAAGD